MTLIINNKAEIRQTILKHIPKEAEITRIEFEGSSIAIYTKRPEIRITNGRAITDVVNLIKKRIVIRSDPSVRMPEKEAQKAITELIPSEAEPERLHCVHYPGLD